MTRRGLVLYTAREQSFFVDSNVLLLFRATAPFRRLLLLWTGVRVLTKNLQRSTQGWLAPYRSPEQHTERITRHWQPVMGTAECQRSTPPGAAWAMVEGQPWRR
jgi:hypothetical protein